MPAEECFTQNAKFLWAQKTLPQGWHGDATLSQHQHCQMIFQLPNIPVWKSSFWEGFTCSVAHSYQTTPTVPVTIQLWMNHYYLPFCNIGEQNEQKFLIRWRSWSLVFAISLPTKLFCLCGNRTNIFPSRPLQNCKITLQQLLQVFAKLVSRCQSLDPELITKFAQAVYN